MCLVYSLSLIAAKRQKDSIQTASSALPDQSKRLSANIMVKRKEKRGKERKRKDEGKKEGREE